MIARYDCKEISKIWNDENRYKLWMKIELLFLSHLRANGEEITPVPEHFPQKWINDIQEIESRTHHDVAAFVEWLENYLTPITTHSRFVHYGLTSSDILDTAFSLQIKQANECITDKALKIIGQLRQLAKKHVQVCIVGRTHGQAAEVTLLSEKFLSYAAAIEFGWRSPVYMGRLAGSVGDQKYFPRDVEIETLIDLGLDVSEYNDGQIIHRAIYAEYMNEWAVLASIIEKIATDIRLLAHHGVEEIREGFSKGQMGSSSMPQKRNPVLSENLCGLARVIRGHQVTAMQNIALWNERDISHSSAERIIFPEASTLLGFMLNRLLKILKNLQVDTAKMAQHVDESLDALSSQYEMLSLIKENGLTRKQAHEMMRNKHIKEDV